VPARSPKSHSISHQIFHRHSEFSNEILIKSLIILWTDFFRTNKVTLPNRWITICFTISRSSTMMLSPLDSGNDANLFNLFDWRRSSLTKNRWEKSFRHLRVENLCSERYSLIIWEPYYDYSYLFAADYEILFWGCFVRETYNLSDLYSQIVASPKRFWYLYIQWNLHRTLIKWQNFMINDIIDINLFINSYM
jgi:hypothetical protein